MGRGAEAPPLTGEYHSEVFASAGAVELGLLSGGGGQDAELLDVSQPAVSQLIRRLEHELGVMLFERSSHHVVLTAAGEQLLPYAQSTLAAAQSLTDQAAAIAGGASGKVRIGTTEGIGPSLNLLLARFRAERPQMNVDLHALGTEEKRSGLRAGELDLAFFRSPVGDPRLREKELWPERMLAVVPADHPAAVHDVVNVTELVELPLIVLDRRANPAMHDEILNLCRSAGIEPTLGPPLRGMQEAQAVIATGRGWLLIAESNAPHDTRGLCVRPLPDPQPYTHVSLAWRAAGLSNPASAFLEVATAAAEAGRLPALPSDA